MQMSRCFISWHKMNGIKDVSHKMSHGLSGVKMKTLRQCSGSVIICMDPDPGPLFSKVKDQEKPDCCNFVK
jgi:hypothetical protein